MQSTEPILRVHVGGHLKMPIYASIATTTIKTQNVSIIPESSLYLILISRLVPLPHPMAPTQTFNVLYHL